MMAGRGVIELEWVSPGRVETKRENENSDEKFDVKETTVKSEVSGSNILFFIN